MKSFTIVCGGVEQRVNVNTSLDGWSKFVENRVRDVLHNGHIHNKIAVGNVVLFRERDISSMRDEIFESCTTYREYTEEEKFLNLNLNADGSISKLRPMTNWDDLLKGYKELEDNLAKKITGEIVDILENPYRDTVLTTTKRVSASGGALKISVTPECNALGIGVGDYVEITIRRV